MTIVYVCIFIDDYVILHTDGSGQYLHQWSLVSDTTIFTIRGCQEAELVLMSVPGNQKWEAFHILLGAEDNQKIIVQKYGTTSLNREFITPDILSCYTHREFWLMIGFR